MSTPNLGCMITSVLRQLSLIAALLLFVAGCSGDPSPTSQVDPFTEGLRFTLIVNGAWSADRSDPRGRTQGQIRATAANKSKTWLGSDTMTPIGATPEEERFSTTVKFSDMEPGAVTIRVSFQHYDSVTDRDITTTLTEVSTVNGDPIEMEDGKVTDAGTIEVTVPQG